MRAVTDDAAIINAIHFLEAPFTLGDARRLVRGDVHGVEYFLGAWRRDGRLVGVIGLGLHGDGVEVGYWLGARHRRRGYAREALGVVLKALGPGRIIAECRRENEASWRLLLRLGFLPANAPGARPGRDLLIRR